MRPGSAGHSTILCRDSQSNACVLRYTVIRRVKTVGLIKEFRSIPVAKRSPVWGVFLLHKDLRRSYSEVPSAVRLPLQGSDQDQFLLPAERRSPTHLAESDDVTDAAF